MIKAFHKIIVKYTLNFDNKKSHITKYNNLLTLDFRDYLNTISYILKTSYISTCKSMLAALLSTVMKLMAPNLVESNRHC